MSRPPTDKRTTNAEKQAHIREAERTRKRDEFMQKLQSDPTFRKAKTSEVGYIIVGYPKP